MNRILNRTVAVLAAGLMLGACEKNAIDDHNVPVEAGAMLKMVHAAEDAPMVNLYLNNQKISAIAPTTDGTPLGLSYARTAVFPVSSGYANVPSGSANIQLLDTVGARGISVMVASQNISLNEQGSYTTFLVGKAGAFEALVVEDDLPRMNYTKSYIRFVNAMIDAPTGFDVKVNLKEPATSTQIGTNVAYKGHTDYAEMEPGTYDFPIYLNGMETAYTTVTNIAPVAGRVYTLYMRGNYTEAPAATNRVLIRDR